jgi:arylsulfatase A-like enzyme
MSDDQGWGDAGYYGHKVLKTPILDEMAARGLRFDRWYAAAPVCSPTRASCLTGRHPFRVGVELPNTGHLPESEITIAEVLKNRGYATGHFGKWHLGTLTKLTPDSRRGGKDSVEDYSPPSHHGFDEYFSTEAKVPTWNPMMMYRDTIGKKKWGDVLGKDESPVPYGTHYWTGTEKMAKDNLEGDDSRIVMERVIHFVSKAAESRRPFFAAVWFHTPHWPVLSGPPFAQMYEGKSEFEKNYFGAITAMDAQIGRLRKLPWCQLVT